jgi:hypothetical protein
MIFFIFIYLFLSALAANWAATKGRDFWTVFFISVAISPLMVIASLWTPFRSKKSSLMKE